MKQVTTFQFNRDEFGYVPHEGKMIWPVYDWANHDYADFDCKDHIKAQAIRTGKMTFTEKSDANPS